MKVSFFNSPTYDFLDSTIIEGMSELGVDLNLYYKENLKNKNFFKNFKGSELSILSANKFAAFKNFDKYDAPKKIILDGTDFPYLKYRSSHEVNAIFKREFLGGLDYNIDNKKVVLPISFGCEERYFSQDCNFNEPRKYDVSCMLNKANFLRHSIEFYLKNAFFGDKKIFAGNTNERSYDGRSGSSIATPSYNEVLSNSIASISAPGRGIDCARYWEILAKGVLLLSYRSPLKIKKPLLPGEHFIEFSDLIELKEKVLWIKENRKEAMIIAKRGHEYCKKFHTTKFRAKYLLEEVSKLSNKTFRANKTEEHDKISPSLRMVLRKIFR